MKPTSSRPPQTLAFAGVDGETGKGATDRIEEIARQARSQRIERVPLPQRPPPTRSSREGLLRERGFGLVLPKGIDPRIESALSPLCAHRKAQAGGLFRRLDYLPGEDHRAWLVRHLLSPGDLDPRKVPGFLLLVGPPSTIPFELQRSLGLSFAVGRLCFPAPEGYAEYANSVVAWETKDEQRCAREVIC